MNFRRVHVKKLDIRFQKITDAGISLPGGRLVTLRKVPPRRSLDGARWIVRDLRQKELGRATRPTVESGRPVRIQVVLRNTTDREFTVFQSVGGVRGEQYYSVSVIGPDGNPAALTAYGAAVLKHIPVAGSRIMRTVKPGGTAKVEYVTVSLLFHMTVPGSYVVQVSRPSPLDSAVILKSNTLIIKVGHP